MAKLTTRQNNTTEKKSIMIFKSNLSDPKIDKYRKGRSNCYSITHNLEHIQPFKLRNLFGSQTIGMNYGIFLCIYSCTVGNSKNTLFRT